MPERVTFTAGAARVTVDPDDGCRLTSLVLAGDEVLFDGEDRPADDPIGEVPFGWGSFVMAPWAGRIRHGRARSGERDLQLTDLGDDGHALHGLVHRAPWTPEPSADGIDTAGAWSTRIDGTSWFGPLTVHQTVRLEPDALHLGLEVHADGPGAAPTPVTVGWHPWFRRVIGDAEVEVELPDGARMLPRDDEGIATTAAVPAPPGPWDDAFVDLDGPVRLRWPGRLELAIDHDGPTTVVFTQLPYAVCVEPQSGPPDEVNLPAPRLAAPGQPVRLATTWRWRSAAR